MKVNRAYGGVTLCASLITGSCVTISNFERMQRQFSFDNEYMDYKFTDIHQKEIGDDPAQFGYPDDGNGRYMQGKSYADWYYVNVAKRVHSNDLEHITVMIPLSLFTGLFLPYQTTGLLATYFVGRQLYTNGYFKREGAMDKQRMVGSMLCNIGHVGIIGMTLYVAFGLRRGKLVIPKTF
eukprot:403341329